MTLVSDFFACFFAFNRYQTHETRMNEMAHTEYIEGLMRSGCFGLCWVSTKSVLSRGSLCLIKVGAGDWHDMATGGLLGPV